MSSVITASRISCVGVSCLLLIGWLSGMAVAAEKKAAPAPAAKATQKAAAPGQNGKKAGDGPAAKAAAGKAQVQNGQVRKADDKAAEAKPKVQPPAKQKPQPRRRPPRRHNRNNNQDKDNNDRDEAPRVLKSEPSAPNSAQTQWQFATNRDMVGWCGDPSDYRIASDGDLMWNVRGDGVHIGRDGGMPNLRTRGLNLKAGGIRKLTVGLQVEKPSDGQLLLIYWSPGSEFAAERSMSATLKNTIGVQDVVFDLASQPKWKGDVSAIKIEPPSGAGEIVIRRVAFE